MKQTFNFLKKFKITDINVKSLSEAIEKQGYTLVEYSRILNSDDVEQLLNALGIKALSLTTGAFTYADENYRIVFIEEGHSEEELLILLAHEEGHIFCGHLNGSNGIVGDDVLKEHQATLFAVDLLRKKPIRSLIVYASANLAKFFTVSVISLFCVSMCVFAGFKLFGGNGGEYCRTRTGTKYHKSDCITVQGHKVTYDTAENFEKLGITPCNVCLK